MEWGPLNNCLLISTGWNLFLHVSAIAAGVNDTLQKCLGEEDSSRHDTWEEEEEEEEKEEKKEGGGGKSEVLCRSPYSAVDRHGSEENVSS